MRDTLLSLLQRSLALSKALIPQRKGVGSMWLPKPVQQCWLNRMDLEVEKLQDTLEPDSGERSYKCNTHNKCTG